MLLSSFSVTVMMGQDYLPGRLALAAGLMIGFGAIGSAPRRGWRCSARSPTRPGRDTALWCVAAPAGRRGPLALVLPEARARREAA